MLKGGRFRTEISPQIKPLDKCFNQFRAILRPFLTGTLWWPNLVSLFRDFGVGCKKVIGNKEKPRNEPPRSPKLSCCGGGD